MDTPNGLKGNCKRKSNEIYDEEDIVPETPDSKVKSSDSSDGVHDTDAKMVETTDKVDITLNTMSTHWEDAIIESPTVLELEAKIETEVNSLNESEQLFDDVIQEMNSKSNSLGHHEQGLFEEHRLERFSIDESERINIDEVISCLTSQVSQPKQTTATAAELITMHNQLALRIDTLFSDVAIST